MPELGQKSPKGGDHTAAGKAIGETSGAVGDAVLGAIDAFADILAGASLKVVETGAEVAQAGSNLGVKPASSGGVKHAAAPKH